MSKKLITLVSTHGKTPEEVSKEVWVNFVKYRATQLGLAKCEACEEYKGAVIEEDGICNGIKCSKCKKNTIL